MESMMKRTTLARMVFDDGCVDDWSVMNRKTWQSGPPSEPESYAIPTDQIHRPRK